MHKHVFILFIVLVLGAATVIPAAAITWGEPDDIHTNVGALMATFPDGSILPACSGTLIHPRVFLTAGHCTVLFDYYAPYYVTFDQDASSTPSLLVVADVITHPDYWWGSQSNPHDVGVLILAEPVTDIEPAILPYEGFLDDLKSAGILRQGSIGAKFTLVGYGASLEWPPPLIYYEDQRQSSVSEYQALLKSWLRLSQNRATNDSGNCYGDSGGPAFYVLEDGTEILVGTTSWGDANCIATGFSYRADIPETLDFIADVIASIEE